MMMEREQAMLRLGILEERRAHLRELIELSPDANIRAEATVELLGVED
jgi:hypothetical protein